MLTPVRVLAVGLVAALSTGLLAVSLSGPSADRAGGFGAPGVSPSAMTTPASRQPIDWDTGCVHLTAGELRINTDTAGDEPGQVFTVEDPVMLNSDPGADTYRTLEATWQEGGSEMRLNLYFAADEDSWWVRELRTYDGQPTPDWITFPGPLLETPLGEAYAGDVVLNGRIGSVPGTLEVRGLTLAVPDFGPGSGPTTCLSTSLTSNFEAEVVAELSPAPDAGSEAKATDASLSPAAIGALDAFAADLLAHCYGREEGVARLSAALVEAGESGFLVRTDGPIGGPDEQMDEITAHVDAGCVIYGGSGTTRDGTRVFYVSGGSGAPTSTFVSAADD
jgi:hypothetical protein